MLCCAAGHDRPEAQCGEIFDGNSECRSAVLPAVVEIKQAFFKILESDLIAHQFQFRIGQKIIERFPARGTGHTDFEGHGFHNQP